MVRTLFIFYFIFFSNHITLFVRCGPCKAIAPLIAEIEPDYAGVIGFAKVDVDESTPLAQKYEITAMPTFIFFKNGEISKSILGANFGSIKNTLEEMRNNASSE